MKSLIKKYIKAHNLAWSSSTLKSEASRLNTISEALNGNATALWSLLTTKKAYTRVTVWTRVVKFWDWCIEEGYKDGKNPYKQFRRKNARLFRGVYLRRVPDISYSDAVARIKQLNDAQVKEKALQLIRTGCRWSESFTYKNGEVVGKGGKRRRIYSYDLRGGQYNKSYEWFRKQLAEVELKPHDLRKIFLNEAVRNNANVFELRALAGWSSIASAQSYIEASEDKLKNLVERINDQK